MDYNIQLMTFHEVNTRIDQPMEHDIHWGIRDEYRVPWVDQSLYSPKLKVINCFIIWHSIKFELTQNSADFIPQTPLSAQRLSLLI
jgi:hypothetical protein